MFDIGFTELLVIGVVALIVIGPERLPKVARTAGHLYGRMQRYVSSVKSDISREIQLDEMRKVGQSFKESVESVASDVEQQATVVDDYLRNEASNVSKAVEAMGATEGERPVTEPAMTQIEASETPQQSLPLEEPDQNPAVTPAAVEPARSENADKPA
ncbi:MAG: Sec-independent protein translocase protein TatB [Thiobacillus sp.]|jgi:sec-independent protein translocase protein TatB|uniref:Sec-independent protein translocase protein TatB n=1 Tax=Thiobacillus sp. TaxID=924 RepID=UPI002894E36D|nr:Sec-independent protein translocase protein TatB [Thiobacillus sp.]MDT3708276.1 Sec-independent protein translocase protein TatB [Thiobacillus sp.]